MEWTKLGGRPRSVGVIGGGTAGYFAALAVKRRFPEIAVTLIESSAVPIIGVGEATTTLMPPFLYGELGLDPVELHRAVEPTLKLGIRFEWGREAPYSFNYPFGDTDPIEAMAFDGGLATQSLTSLLMDHRRAPVLRGPRGELLSLLPRIKFAYHLDNVAFVRFLADAARRSGIAHIDATIEDVVRSSDGARIERVRAAGGLEIGCDLFVDASGFRSLLVEGALGSPFTSYASSLFCDRAIVASVPRLGPSDPFTTAETMSSGWCWRIPVAAEDHRGYVYASSWLDEDAAVAEMRANNPEMGEPRTVRFRSGRHRDFWSGNVVGVGNAYGFVEPLESTALHMVIVEIGYLLAGLEALGEEQDGRDFIERANAAVGSHWDYLRWFLAAHYKFNRRLDSPFWRAARADVDVSGIEASIERLRREGPRRDNAGRAFDAGDPAFGFSGLMTLLFGQGAIAAPPPPIVDRTTWDPRVAKQRAMVARALSHDEGLRVLRDHPEMLRALVTSPSSWCRSGAERVSVHARSFEAIHPRSGMPSSDETDEALLRALR